MFSLFQNPGTPRQPQFNIPELTNGFLGLKTNALKLKQYCRSNPSKVNGKNVLLRLLHRLPISLYQDVQFYYDSIYDQQNDIASSVQISNIATKGRAHRDVLFSDSLELPIALSDGKYLVDRTTLTQGGWRDLAPIRFLRHDCSDLRMERFNGYVTQPGLSVWLVDIPLLALQYLCWCREQLERGVDGLGPEFFLAMYPLPNAIESWLDVAWVNRARAKLEFDTYTHGLVSSSLPIHFSMNHSRLEAGLDEIVYRMRMGSRSYADLLCLVRTPFTDTAEKLLRLPDIYLTDSVRWSLGVGQIGWLWWLTKHDNGNNGSQNARSKREIKLWFSASTLVRLLDRPTRDLVEAEFLQVLAY